MLGDLASLLAVLDGVAVNPKSVTILAILAVFWVYVRIRDRVR